MFDFQVATAFIEELRSYCNKLIDLAKNKVGETKKEKENLIRLIVENSTMREEDLLFSVRAEASGEPPRSGITDFDSALKFRDELKVYFNELADNAKEQMEEAKTEKDDLMQTLENLQASAQAIPHILAEEKKIHPFYNTEKRQGVETLGFWEEPPFEEYVSTITNHVACEGSKDFNNIKARKEFVQAQQGNAFAMASSGEFVGAGWDLGSTQERDSAAPVEMFYDAQSHGAPGAEAIKNRYIVGKLAGKHLVDHRGSMIIERGALITPDTIKKAEEEGKLVELILNMTWKKE